MQVYAERIARLREGMESAGAEYAVFSPSADMRYISGVNAYASERLTCCVIGRQDALFLLPAFELPMVPQEKRGLMEFRGWVDGEDPFAILRAFMEGARHALVGRDVPGWALLRMQQILPDCHWELADGLITPLRAVKDASEYAAIRDVHARSARALMRLVNGGLCGMSEAAAARKLGDCFLEEGVQLNMAGVASGPNSASAHHMSGERVINEGDVVWIDFGGIVPGVGYQSDITRTFAIKRVPEGFKEIYETVRQANEAAFQAARPGVRCEEIDAAGRWVIERAGYGAHFTHRLGHGLGLDMHEQPYIAPGNAQTVQAGNVFSDEPGIYIPGKYGVRIEDILFIGEDGAERMTPLPHELMVID